jgi:hypothetical protein
MDGVTTERALNRLTPANLHHHRIIRIPERPYLPLAIYLLNINNKGMMADYRVRIGEFRVYVKVLNLHLKANWDGRKIGSGTFGSILEKSVA